MNGLRFALRVESQGYEVDQVTAKKKTWISCTGPKLDQLAGRLQDLEFTYSEGTVFAEARLTLCPKDMYTVIERAQALGMKVVEEVPFFIWKLVSQVKASIDPDVIRTQVGPEIWDKLHGYQKVGVQRMVEWKRCYSGDEMGCGKTLQSLVASKFFAHLWPVLIVCPSSLRYTWRSEIINWLGVDPTQITVIRKAKDFGKIKPHSFLIISYSLLIRPDVQVALTTQQYQVAILDEAHYIKSITSKRSAAALRLVKNCQVLIMLSGTPFNYPSEMFQQIKAIDPTIYPWFFNYSLAEDEPGKYYFAKRYCDPTKFRFRNTDSWVFHGYERSEELHAVLNTFMIRRKKLDVLSQLPPKHRVCITLPPLNAKQQKQLDKLLKGEPKKKKKKASESKEKQLEVKAPENSRDTYMEAFRLASQFKEPHVLEFIQDQVVGDLLKTNPKAKLLIFFHHQQMGQVLKEALEAANVSHFVIDGKTNPLQRQTYVETFQTSDKYSIALLSISAAGVGLTLTAASTVIFTEVLFGPDLHLQAEDRSHRMGQTNNVNIFYLLLPGSTDDINFGLLKKKERNSAVILEGHSTGNMASERMQLDENMPSLSVMTSRKRKLEKTEDREEKEAPPAVKQKIVIRRATPAPQECYRLTE